jgi:multiple sugar transport system permease protein
MSTAPRSTTRKRKRWFSEENVFVASAMVPCVLYYALFSGFPILFALYLSVQNWSLIDEPEFVGLGNYIKVLTDDPVFFMGLKNTAIYAVGTVLIGMVLALFVALLINNLKKATGVFRTIYFLPVITSMVAASVVWRWLYQGQFGLFNQILSLLGMNKVPWLDSPKYALPSLMAMSIWKGLGFTAVLFMAGLQSIPPTFYDAAQIDGANRWKTLIHITIPLLQPTIVFVLITGFIGGFQAFTEMFIMTRGGPMYSTTTIVMHLYERAFEYFQMGYASAVAFILFAIIIGLTAIQLRLTRIGWEY